MKCPFRNVVLACILMMSASLGFGQTFVQYNTAVSSTSVTTLTIPFLSTQTVKSLNIVAISWATTANTITSVTDTQGNTYSVAAAKLCNSTIVCGSIYYAKNIKAGSNTVTVTLNASTTFPEARITEYSGLDTNSPLDVTAGAVGSGNAASSGAATTATANELIFGSGTTSTHFTVAGSGFTSRGINSFGSISEDKSVAVIGSNSATGTVSSGSWVMQMATFKVAAAAPTVTSISPTSGLTTGGTAVTLTGTGFVAGATVTIGGTAATSVVVVNGTTITATTPVHTAGLVNVVATNTDTQIGTLTNGYTYTAPIGIQFVQVNAATPQIDSASVPVAMSLTQTAGNLNIVAIGWDDITSTINSVTDSRGNTYVLATGITHSATNSQVIYYAKNIAGLNNTVTVAFNVPVKFADVRVTEYSGLDTTNPLDVVSSASGTAAVAATVSSGSATTTAANELIYGAGISTTHFTGPGTGFTSRIITVPDSDIAEDQIVSSIGSNNATAVLAASDWVMQMATFRAPGQIIPAPTVTSISPVSGITSGVAVTITGTGFSAGATVTMGGVSATNVVVVSSTSITATAPAHAVGAVSVVVTNTDSQTGTLTNGFTYTGIPNPTPTISSTSPTSGPAGGSTTITIIGTGFLSGATVTVGGVVAGVSSVSSTTINATTGAHAAGLVNVIVTNTDGLTVTSTSAYTYVASPVLSSLSPTSGPIVGSTSVTLTGTGFLSGVMVSFGGISASNIVAVNSTTITAKTPVNSAGIVDVTVTNTDGQSSTKIGSYTYTNPAPTIVSILPITGPINGGTNVIITGTGFLNGLGVKVGGTTASSVSVLSTTSISITTPAHALGTASIVVTNSDGQAATLANSFTYAVIVSSPSISSVVPALGSTIGGNRIAINGSNFLTGATVTIGGIAATSIIVVNAGSVTATAPAHTAGIVNVVVTNTDSQSATLTNGYVYTSATLGGTTTSTSSGAITIEGTEQVQSTVSLPGTGRITISGTCIESCGPLSTTVNGRTNSVSYTQGINAGIRFVQGNSTQRTSETIVPILFKVAQGGGNLNIVVVKWNDTAARIASVDDTSGNSYGLLVGPTQGFGLTQAIYYAKNITAATARSNIVNVTFDIPATFPDVHIYEYSGLGNSDVISDASGTTNPTNSGSATTHFLNELVFGAGAGCGAGFAPAGAAGGVGFVVPGSGFIQRQLTPYGDLGEDKIVSSIASYNSSGFVNCSGWVMQMATFWAGVTPDILATKLADQINSDRLAVVKAQPIGPTIYLTSKITGPTTNYDLSIVSCCNISMDISGDTLIGGQDPQATSDTGTVSATINGIVYTYNYSQADIPESIAAGLTTAINADTNAFVIATTAGRTVNLITKASGSVNYPISVTSVSTNAAFASPSFTAVTSGANLVGGFIQHSVLLVWPVSISPNVIGYNVYRATSSGGPYTLITPQVSTLSYNDNTVLSGATYYYVITSVDNAGREGVFSIEAPAVIPSP